MAMGRVVLVALVVFQGGAWLAEGKAASPASLPGPAAAAVAKLFPRATLVGVGQEREGQVAYYEVTVQDGTRQVELEVTADGSVGEVEAEVAIGDCPTALRGAVSRLVQGGTLARIERHEVRGVPHGSRFTPLDPPLVVYEVGYRLEGVQREAVLNEDGSLRATDEDDASDDASEEEGDSLDDDDD